MASSAYDQSGRAELFTHLIKVKDNDPVVDVHVRRVREHVQAALRNKLGGEGDFPRFGVWLLQDFGAPVGQKRHRQRTFYMEIVLVDTGCASVDDGFLRTGQ